MRTRTAQLVVAAFPLLLVLLAGEQEAHSQCSGIVTSPSAASSCASRSIPDGKVTSLDPQHQYSLAELIDIGERNNPQARSAWERARQRAEQMGIEKSEYFPLLAGEALFADERQISPFPKPLVPRGYTTVEAPLIQPEVSAAA